MMHLRLGSFVATLAWMGTVHLVAEASPQQPSALGTVTGFVVADGGDSRPVRGAVVTLKDQSGTSWTTFTDRNGAFAFGRVADGLYAVTAVCSGFVAPGARSDGESGTPVSVTVDAAKSLGPLRLMLMRGAVISGLIREPDGRPAQGAVVSLSNVSRSVLTDDRGEYRIFGLAPGAYVVTATARVSPSAGVIPRSADEVDAILADLRRKAATGVPGSLPRAIQPAEPKQESSSSSPLRFAPVYYPGVVDVTAAQPVQVRFGQEASGIDFPLVLAGTVQVGGVVRDLSGNPAAGVRVWVEPETGALRSAPISARTAGDGSFVLRNIVPGSYRILALDWSSTGSADSRATSDSTSSRWAVLLIEQRSDTLGVNLTLQPAMGFSGRVVFDGPNPQRGEKDSPVISLVPASPYEKDWPVVRATVRADGTFEARGVLPVTYVVSGTVPDHPEVRLRSAMAGKVDLLDSPPQFGSDIPGISGAILTFSNRRTGLSGRLLGWDPSRGERYVVVVFSVNPALRVRASRRLQASRPGPDGTYAFDVPAGDYFLAVARERDFDLWPQSAYIELLSSGAVRVNLTEGEQKVQDLRLGLMTSRH